MDLNIGDMAPDFTLPGDGGKDVALADFKGKKLVLYFYPKDNTSGCTTQAITFQAFLADFEKAGAAIVGVSKDSPVSHDKFKQKQGFTFRLASDEDGALCEKFGVWVEKSMYGRKYFGIERSTFLIDENGAISRIWRKVKVKGHAEEVLAALEDKA